jgi:hypothetical protein
MTLSFVGVAGRCTVGLNLIFALFQRLPGASERLLMLDACATALVAAGRQKWISISGVFDCPQDKI